MEVIKKYLDGGQYVGVSTKKTAIVIHHTAGNYRPDFVIDSWNNDKIGRIGTHYVIGGLPSSNSFDTSFDGKIYQAIDEKYYAYNLGIKNQKLEQFFISIELCNFGYVLGKNDGKFYSYVHTPIYKNQVIDLGYSFRGYRYWHKYTDKQIESLNWLINDICERHEIKKNKISFDFDESLLSKNEISGIYTHANFRKDKFDCYPYEKLINIF